MKQEPEMTKVISDTDALMLVDDTKQVTKFDNGRYQWTGSLLNYVGREVPKLPGVYAVFPTQRHDEHGAYVQLLCVTDITA